MYVTSDVHMTFRVSLCLAAAQRADLKVEADMIRKSGSSKQWRRKCVQNCGMSGSSFDHYDIILVEKTTAARGGIYIIMRTYRVIYTLTLPVSFFEGLAKGYVISSVNSWRP